MTFLAFHNDFFCDYKVVCEQFYICLKQRWVHGRFSCCFGGVCGASWYQKILFCCVVGSATMFFVVDATRAPLNGLVWCQWTFPHLFFLLSLKNCNFTFFIVDFSTLIPIFIYIIFGLDSFVEILFVFNFIIQFQFIKYYILQCDPYS